MPNVTTKLYNVNYYMDMKCKEFGLKFSGFEPASTSMSYHTIITDPNNKYISISISNMNLMQDTYKLELLLENLFNNAVESLKAITPKKPVKVGTAAPININWNVQTPTATLGYTGLGKGFYGGPPAPPAATLKDSNFKADYGTYSSFTLSTTPMWTGSMGGASSSKPPAPPQPTKPLTFNDLYAKELGLAPAAIEPTKGITLEDLGEAYINDAKAYVESEEFHKHDPLLAYLKKSPTSLTAADYAMNELKANPNGDFAKYLETQAPKSALAEPSFAAGQYPGNLKDALEDMLKKDLDNASKSLTKLFDEMNHITMDYVKGKK